MRGDREHAHLLTEDEAAESQADVTSQAAHYLERFQHSLDTYAADPDADVRTWPFGARVSENQAEAHLALQAVAAATFGYILACERARGEVTSEVYRDRITLYVDAVYESGTRIRLGSITVGAVPTNDATASIRCRGKAPLTFGGLVTVSGEMMNRWFCVDPEHHDVDEDMAASELPGQPTTSPNERN